MSFKVINDIPFIGIKNSFLTDKECDELIASAKNQGFQPSDVVVGDSNIRNDEYRTSSDCYLERNQNTIDYTIRKRLSKLISHNEKYFELTTIINYNVGQFYKPHYDYFYEEQSLGRRQRIATAILYLNTPVGGETTFPNLNIVHKPTKGDLLFFRYDYKEFKIRDMTLHEGKSPTEGEKWIATIWVQKKKNIFSIYDWLF